MYNANLLIDNDIIEQSQEICKFITDPVVRNRAVANVVSAKTVLNYFSDKDVDITSGLHNIPQILKHWDLSDIYVNNAYIDIRLYFDKDEIFVPKYHFDYNLLPTVYMFVKVDQDLSNATVVGFIEPQKIDITIEHGEYYKIEEDIIVPYSDVESLLTQIEMESFADIGQELYSYLDNTPENQLELSAYLLKSKDARLKLANIANAKNVFTYISIDSALQANYDELDVIDFDDDSTTKSDSNSFVNSSGDFTSSEIIEFATEVEPSINSIENSEEIPVLDFDEETVQEQALLEDIEKTDAVNEAESTEDENLKIYKNEMQEYTEDNYAENSESNIDNLFNADSEVNQIEASSMQTKKKSNFLPILGLLVIASAVGYYCLNKNSYTDQSNVNSNIQVLEQKNITTKDEEPIAMPVESVENPENNIVEEIGNPISIPEIENNLDTSILISNLAIKWEVPISYVSNVTAKRYFTKIGKIIQINLKTELLLLSKIPISNKITLSLEFDKSLQKFKVKDIISTSGEEQIDNVIKKSVNNVLNNNYNFNMKVFNDLQGNPNLLINL